MGSGSLSLRRLVVGSAVATGVLMLLGVYTAAAGAGLTCAGRWPLCDGAVFGLFPANWGSFIEWFHRLVAMLTGFLILGTTVAAWRQGLERRVRYALAGATLLLPSQIALGALTVTEYEILILTAHFVTASIIFAATVAAAAWAVAPVTVATLRRRVGLAGGTLVALAGLSLALSPRLLAGLPSLTYTPTVQFVYYGLGLAAFGTLVAATLWLGDGDAVATDARGPWLAARAGTVAAAAVLLTLLVFGRLVNVAGPLPILGATGAFALVAVAAYFLRDVAAAAAADRRATAGD
jgi:cytochrome c oxidase assembly protein subunit 15